MTKNVYKMVIVLNAFQIILDLNVKMFVLNHVVIAINRVFVKGVFKVSGTLKTTVYKNVLRNVWVNVM